MVPLIKVEDLSFSYPSNNSQILSNCSFEIHKGDMISLLGANGAGKSTLMNCMCGILQVKKGQIFIDGNDITSLSDRKIATYIGYVQQSQEITFPYTVFDYILMGCANKVDFFKRPSKKEIESVAKVMREMGIDYLAEKSMTEISGGEKQQAAIARAIVQDPQIIFFDEPTAHLDYGNQMRTLHLIHKLNDKGYTIVMTTHTPDHCIVLDGKVAIINKNGGMIFGDSSKLITEESLRSIYQINVKICYVDDVKRNVCIPKEL